MSVINDITELNVDDDWDSIILVSNSILGLNPGLEFAVSPGRKNAAVLGDHKVVTAIKKHVPELRHLESHNFYAFDVTLGGPLSRIYGIEINEAAQFALKRNNFR